MSLPSQSAVRLGVGGVSDRWRDELAQGPAGTPFRKTKLASLVVSLPKRPRTAPPHTHRTPLTRRGATEQRRPRYHTGRAAVSLCVAKSTRGAAAMPTFEHSLLIHADRAVLFTLTQDYQRRLTWDPFLIHEPIEAVPSSNWVESLPCCAGTVP